VIELTEYATLPSGQRAGFTLGRVGKREYIAVRVEGRICVAHGDWMDLGTARAMAAAVFELASEEE
jgi:hypothetical protein